MAGLLHRIGAVITFLYFGMHLVFVIKEIVTAEDGGEALYRLEEEGYKGDRVDRECRWQAFKQALYYRRKLQR